MTANSSSARGVDRRRVRGRASRLANGARRQVTTINTTTSAATVAATQTDAGWTTSVPAHSRATAIRNAMITRRQLIASPTGNVVFIRGSATA